MSNWKPRPTADVLRQLVSLPRFLPYDSSNPFRKNFIPSSILLSVQSGPDSAMKRKSPDANPLGARPPVAKKPAVVATTAATTKAQKDRPLTWEEHCDADPSLSLDAVLRRKIVGKGGSIVNNEPSLLHKLLRHVSPAHIFFFDRVRCPPLHPHRFLSFPGSFDLKGKYEESHRLLSLCRAALVYLRSAADEKEAERAELEDKIRRMAADMDEMERRANGDRDESARALLHSQSQVRKLTEEQLRQANDRRTMEVQLKAKEDELRSLRDQMARMTLEFEHAQRTVEAEQERTRQAEASLAKSQEYVGHLQSFNTNLQQQVTQLQEQVGAFSAERSELVSRTADLQGQVQAAQHQLEALRSTAMDADSVRRAAEQEINRLKGEIDAAQRARSQLSEEVSADRARLSTRVTELEGMLNMAAMYKEEADKRRNEAVAHAEALEARIEQWKVEAEAAVNAARAEAAHATQAAQAAQHQAQQASAETAQLRQCVTEQHAELQAKAADLERIRSERSKYAATAQSQEERLRQLSGDLEQLRMHNAALQDTQGNRNGEVYKLIDHNKMLEQRVGEMERLLRDAETERKKLHNQVQELKGNIRVYCRIRPMAPHEASSSGSQPAIQPAQAGLDRERRVELQVPNAQDASRPAVRSNFSFDRVFGAEHGQGHVFEEISQLVQSSLDGYRVCIFAYGQTGSGKTHTMIGTPDEPGMIPRSMQMIFEKGMAMASQGWTFSLGASMLEIYNENIRDLLARPSTPAPEHKIGLDGSVTNLTVMPVHAPEQAQALISQAMGARTVGATQMNEQSSRSHCVFQLRIQATNAATGQASSGMLNLIDLAGSERLKQSGATGDRKKETEAINSSLSYLKDVMLAIKNKQSHVPFRNSILTRLLEQSMKGDSKVLMFCNVSPAVESASETLSSLRFAATVNECTVGAPKKTTAVLGAADENAGPSVAGAQGAAGQLQGPAAGPGAGGVRRPATAGPVGGARRL